MYVIVEIAGQQFKAEKGRKLYVHRLPGENRYLCMLIRKFFKRIYVRNSRNRRQTVQG